VRAGLGEYEGRGQSAPRNFLGWHLPALRTKEDDFRLSRRAKRRWAHPFGAPPGCFAVIA
jgi:hypothetical protein